MQKMIKRALSLLLVACCAFSTVACQGEAVANNGALNDSVNNSIDSINSSTPPMACTEHNFKSQILKEAACGEKGSQILTCENCGVYYVEDIPGLDHEYTSKVTREPTKTMDGIRTYTCTRGCGASYREDIPRFKPSIDTGGYFRVDENGEAGTLRFENFFKYYEKDGYINYSEYNRLIYVSHDWSSVHLRICYEHFSEPFPEYRMKFFLQLYKGCYGHLHEGGELVCEQEYSKEDEGSWSMDVFFEFTEPLEDDVSYVIKFAKVEVISLE
ncbi:MAG: hypothetical protein IJX30_02170 [Clostridia bacterium]|nr:hypothetical protein [Clostridia bacterium]